MEEVRPDVATAEEKLVAELALLGISYLTRQTDYQANQVRPPEQLFVDLLQQPSARVRAAVIAVLLAHPDYAKSMPCGFHRFATARSVDIGFFLQRGCTATTGTRNTVAPLSPLTLAVAAAPAGIHRC